MLRQPLPTADARLVFEGVMVRTLLAVMPPEMRENFVRLADEFFADLVQSLETVRVVRIIGEGADPQLPAQRLDALATWEAVKAASAQDHWRI